MICAKCNKEYNVDEKGSDDLCYECMPWIKIDDCKDGYLYIINARNAHIGIFNARDNSFTISRFKFKDNYLFDEYHWDMDAFGTAKPFFEIGKMPEHYNENIIRFLNKFYQLNRTAIDTVVFNSYSETMQRLVADCFPFKRLNKIIN